MRTEIGLVQWVAAAGNFVTSGLPSRRVLKVRRKAPIAPTTTVGFGQPCCMCFDTALSVELRERDRDRYTQNIVCGAQ